ncbi:hypothetical protein [Rhodococcus opacus]|uniref:hypothetical protein n=1 Tax=Rhodococcus opacus TaxID=37919 RepID=UPI001F573F4B|nr:hypothetical protein [Rhodococcus opacus]UNN05353.1 hypothetical protein MOO23_40800 [Rhodococcus opacus]
MTTEDTESTDHKPDSSPAADQRPRSGWWGRTAATSKHGLGFTFWLAVVFVFVVVAGGGVAYFVSRDDNDTAEGQAPVTLAPQTERADWGLPFTDELGRRVEVPPNPDGVVLDQDTDSRKPASDITGAPGGLQWQRIRNFPLPFSTTDGPTGIEGRMATGFAQTPRGAALAGIQLYTRGGATMAGAAEFYADRVVPDSDPLEQLRQDFLRRATDAIASGRGDERALLPYFRVDAYRVTQWDPQRPDYAVVEYAMLKESRTGWVSKSAELLWRDGDWQIKLTADLYGGQKEVSNLGGWTQWAAN